MANEQRSSSFVIQGLVVARRPMVWPIWAGACSGIATGLAMYWLFNLSDVLFFTVAGLLCGVAGGLVVAFFRRGISSMLLVEATVTVPQFTALKFVTNRDYQRVAWKLFVETMSRIATQPIPEGHGVIREALSSLYSLFGTVRDLLKQMEPSQAGRKLTVELLALQMLNQHVRPFLSKWHPLLQAYEVASKADPTLQWSRENDCRRELEALRIQLVDYAKAFGELSGVTQLDQFFGAAPHGQQ